MIGAKLLILCTSFPSLFLFYNLSLLALFIRNQSLSLLALLFVSYFTYWKFFAFNSHEEIQIQENKSYTPSSMIEEKESIAMRNNTTISQTMSHMTNSLIIDSNNRSKTSLLKTFRQRGNACLDARFARIFSEVQAENCS